MCWQDLEIGGLSRAGYAAVSAPVAVATPLVSAEMGRIALMLSVVGAVSAVVAPETLDSTNGQGFLLSSALPPLILTLQSHGWVTLARWTATGIGGTAVVTVVETFLERPPSNRR